ncbi:MAG: PAS domain S-box protein, partial [Treponema sp.]|nr:PAS domain S-box protein [Treponema sp.]
MGKRSNKGTRIMKNRNGKKPDLSILKKILPKRTIHWQIAFTLLAFAAVVFFSYLIMNTAIRSHLARNSTLTLDLAMTKIEAELRGPETTLRAFAETAQQRIQQGANINSIREFLVSFDKHLSYHTQDQTSPLYLFGVFYTLGPNPVFMHNGGWVPPEDYIPQNRPWYQAAVAGGGLPARSQLYMDRSSDEYVFAIAQSIQDESGRQLGVVCLQVPINHLGRIIKETAEAQGGYGMILGQDLRVHSHTNTAFEGMELPNPRLPFSIFYENFLRGEDVFENPIISFAGEASLAFFRRTQDGWYYGTVVPQAPYYKSITNAWYSLILIGAFSAAFLMLILARTDARKNRATALTYSLNKMSEIFLTHNGNNYDDVMGTGGKLLAELADIDRFAILRNSTEGGDLYMSQIYRWEKAMGGTTRVNDNFVHVPYKRVAPAWEQMFKEGKSLSGPVRLMPEREAALLDSLGDYSAFIAPIHIGGAPWGFVLYEDQKRERHFDKALEETMQSAAFLLANAVLSAEFETKLAAERDFTRNIIDSAPIGINIWDDNLNIIDCNDAVENIFGCKKQYYIEHFNEFSPEYQSDGEKTIEKVKKLQSRVRKGEIIVSEWEHTSATGEPIPCEITMTRLNYNDKNIILVYLYDLRNIKKMEAAALDAEQTLALIDAVPLGCTLIDKNMNVLTCNKTEVEFLKLSKKEDIKRLFVDFVPEYQNNGSSSKEAAYKAIKTAFDEGYAFHPDWTHINTQGEILPCEVTLVRVEYGGDQVVAAYLRDMRAVKEAEAMAREADKRALLMIEHAPLIITLWNKDHQILDCNQAAIRILGMASKEDYINKFYERTPERQPDGTPSYALVQGVLAKAFNDGYARFEWTSINAQTGEDIPMDVTFVRIKYKDEYAVMTYGLDLRERNAALAQTREAEQRVELMLEKAPLIALMWDSNFHLIDCNEEAARIFGLSNKEEVKKRFFELLPEYQPNGITSQEMLLKAQTMIFQEKMEITKIELTMHHAKTGEPIPIAITLVRIDDNSVLTYGHDLRERNAAIAKIREADERTQLIFDAAPLASCMFSKDIVALDCNQEMVKMCGLKDKKSFLKRYTEFVPEYQPDGSLSSEVTVKNIQIAFEKGYNQFEFTHRKESGELFPVKSTLLPVKYRGEDMVAAYFIDLTEQKVAEHLTKEVMKKTSTLTAIFNSTPDMIFCKDIDLFYTECNKAMENYFNVRNSDIIGKPEAIALNIPAEIAEHLLTLDKRVLAERQEITTEEQVRSFDGKMLYFEMIRSPLVQEGEVTGLVGIARDITQRKAAEENLNRQNSLMNTVNAAAAVLLEPDTDGSLGTISRSMEMVCQSVDADRVFLWKNSIKDDGSLHYRQMYKWTRPEFVLDDDFPEYSYEDVMPVWKNLLFEGKGINGPLDTLPGYDSEIFSIYSLQSILIVPLFLKGEYWGFVSFDDCHSRRSFPAAD